MIQIKKKNTLNLIIRLNVLCALKELQKVSGIRYGVANRFPEETGIIYIIYGRQRFITFRKYRVENTIRGEWFLTTSVVGFKTLRNNVFCV